MKDSNTEEGQKRYSVLDVLKKNNPEVPITSAVLKQFVLNPKKPFRANGHLYTPIQASKLLSPYIGRSTMSAIKKGNIKPGAKLVPRGDKYVLAAEGGLITDKKSTPPKSKNKAKPSSVRLRSNTGTRKSASKYSCGLFK